MKLFIKTRTLNRKIREAEMNIIEKLERRSIDSDTLDKIVDIVSTELDKIVVK